MKHIYFLLILVTAAFAQSNGQTYKKTDLGVKATVNATDIEIQVYSPSIIRVLKNPSGNTFVKNSLSVIKVPGKTEFSIRQNGSTLFLKTQKLLAELDLQNGKLSFSSLKGQPLLKEKEAGVSFTDFDDAGKKTYSVAQSFILDKEEAVYGLGILQNGKMSQRNQEVKMVQNNTWDFVTFFQSVKGYGLFWDNYSPTVFKDNEDGTSFSSEVGDGIDYYFMYGENADGTIARMRDLTGQVPMFPLWTYGYWQSRERYKSQDEIVNVVKKYRALEVPLDGIIQDWQYWGNNYLWNAMDFLNPEFPDPEKMVNDIHDLKAHLIISIWSSFGPQTIQYRKLDSIGALFSFKTWPLSGRDIWPPDLNYPSGVRAYDVYNPAARDIYWKYLKKGLFSLGIDGWWMDSSEPDVMYEKDSYMDASTFLGSLRKMRNAYPLMAVGGVSSHQRADDSSKRVFILTRSAFAGQQRYGANTWSGDVNSSLQSLRNQVPAGLNFSLTGIPYWNSDIGGFFAGAYNKGWNNKGGGVKNPAFQELYVRWLQFAAFTPMMRSHGTDVPREIYHFGKKGEPVYDAIEKSINLRYSLLPYIYSAAWDVTHNQSSIMRALAMDFKDKNVWDINNEYLFGKSILVAPVVKAQYTPEEIIQTNENTGWDKQNNLNKSDNSVVDFNQVKNTAVYLPAGSQWYNFWTNEKLNGGQQITQPTSFDEIPLYIKAGSIIPFGPRVQYAAEKKWDNLEIRVYAGADGEFTLYEDENDNYDYEKGLFSTITLNWNDKKKTVTIGNRSGSFPGMLQNREFRIVIVSPGKGRGDEQAASPDKIIRYDGKKIEVKF